LATLSANERSGISDYSFRYQLSNSQTVIYYRVKVMQKNMGNKYSNTVLLRPVHVTKNTPLIFPNPSQGEVWMSLESSEKTQVAVSVSDMAGRLIKTLQIPVIQGNNLVSLNALTRQMAGVYIIKIKTADGETTQKLLLKK